MESKKYKYEISVFLRSGHTVTVKCDEWEFKNNHDGTYSGYSFKGTEEGTRVSFSLPDIVGFKSKTLINEKEL